MNKDQKKQCQYIIHTHAAIDGLANAIPTPGLGTAADLTAMTTMCMSLCAVFGGNIPEKVAEGMAIAALRRTVLKQPIKVLTKTVSKYVPVLGQVIAPTISVAMMESAGWTLAHELEAHARSNGALTAT